jgi:hypothetical protein
VTDSDRERRARIAGNEPFPVAGGCAGQEDTPTSGG